MAGTLQNAGDWDGAINVVRESLPKIRCTNHLRCTKLSPVRVEAQQSCMADQEVDNVVWESLIVRDNLYESLSGHVVAEAFATRGRTGNRSTVFRNRRPRQD